MSGDSQNKSSGLKSILYVLLAIVVGVGARNCGSTFGENVAGQMTSNHQTGNTSASNTQKELQEYNYGNSVADTPKADNSFSFLNSAKACYESEDSNGEYFSIYLPEVFEETLVDGFAGAVEYENMTIMWNNESFNSFEAAGIDPDTVTVRDYTLILSEAIPNRNISVYADHDYPYITYVENGYGYCVCTYKEYNNFWMLYFICDENTFWERLPGFRNQAETVIAS